MPPLVPPPPAHESPVARTTPAAILQAVAQRLREATGLTEHACFVSLDPRADAARLPGDLWITVSPMSGQFSARQIMGGGLAMLATDWGIIVGIHSTNRLDEIGRDPLWMAGEGDRSMALLDRCLVSLTGWGIDEGLRDPLSPERFDLSRDGKMHQIELVLSCAFDWYAGDGLPATTDASDDPAEDVA